MIRNLVFKGAGGALVWVIYINILVIKATANIKEKINEILFFKIMYPSKKTLKYKFLIAIILIQSITKKIKKYLVFFVFLFF